MAALRHYLWQDAAKLLSIYGSEYMSEYSNRFIPPAKYHLTFFECTLCVHHAARLTADDMIEGKWREQTKFEEAYWGNTDVRALPLSVLAAAPRASFGVFSYLSRRRN